MFSSLSRMSVRHPRGVAVVALMLFVIGGVFGGPAAGLLKARNGFQDPGSEAARAQNAVERATGAEPGAGVLALVSARLSSPAVASVARAIAVVPASPM